MKIQKVLPKINKLKNVQRYSPKNTNFRNHKFGEDIRVKEIDYNGIKIPYVYQEKRNPMVLDIGDLRKNINKAFRDDELFNAKRDEVDFSYSKYDEDDVINPKQYLLSAKEDFLQERKIVTNRNQYFETDSEIQEFQYRKIYDDRDSVDYFEMKAWKNVQKERKEAYKQLDKMSYLERFNKSIYSFELSDCVLDKFKRGYSMSEIEDVVKLAKKKGKYTDRGKSYIVEEVSCKRIDIYFDLKDKKKINDIEEYKKLLKFAEYSYWGDERLVFELITDLTEKASLDDVIKTYSKENECGYYRNYVNTEKDKQEQFIKMSKILENK